MKNQSSRKTADLRYGELQMLDSESQATRRRWRQFSMLRLLIAFLPTSINNASRLLCQMSTSMNLLAAKYFAVIVGSIMALASSTAIADRPNIVLILADDLGYETVGCYGGTSYPTPNLDKLARQGVRFDHAYAMPLCTNTRIQLMTGKYNHRNWKAFGILDPQADTLGRMMQRAGYKTCIAGKWQLTSYDPPDYPGAALRRNTGMRVETAGYDEYSLWHTGHTEDKGSRYADPVIFENGKFRSDTQGKYGPDLWVDFIGDFMQRHRDEPFFVYYPMALPHNPMVPTPDSPAWSDPARRHSDETPFAADMIRYTDKLVGKVVGKLNELGIRENTLVLFYSDNGTNPARGVDDGRPSRAGRKRARDRFGDSRADDRSLAGQDSRGQSF